MILDKLHQFKGQRIIDVASKIKTLAAASGYSIEVHDPVFNTGDIMTDTKRVSIMTDPDGRITEFRVG